MKSFDIAIIGSGPGGYVSAIRCAQLGFSVALIEKYNTLGGTCLNVGCIPSKALLDSSEHFFKAKKEFAEHGIYAENLNINIQEMINRKSKVVSQTVAGIDYLMNKNKIEVIRGLASFENNTILNINQNGENIQINAKNIIIATGSKPSNLPFAKIDKERVITSTEALNLKEIPKKLLVIGGGIIGLEMSSIYNRIGSDVEVIEYADKIGGAMDSETCKELQRVLKKQGIKFHTSMKVFEVTRNNNEVKVKATDSEGKEYEFIGDYCLVAVGRNPYTEELNLDKVGIITDKRGRIAVDNELRTNIKNIYAIGDVIEGPMLAHKAEEEGVYVAELLAGQKPNHLNHKLIPGIAYTWPEAAGIGYSEDELKSENRAYKIGKFQFKASGRARASNDTDGFVKVLADKETDEILGVQILGARAADIIMQGAIAILFRASSEDIAMSCFGHPTFSEALKEACLAATDNRAIHA